MLRRYLPKWLKNLLRPGYIAAFGWYIEKVRKDRVLSLYTALGIFGKGDVVFDIGTNIGEYTEAFLQLGANVVCVEPDPRCLQVLKRKFGNDSRVKILGVGISEKEGYSVLKMCEISVASTFSENFCTPGFEEVGSVKTRMVTLDSLIKEHGMPKYCKIDVEGYELHVLGGLSTAVPFLSFEFHSDSPKGMQACLDRIRGLGMEPFRIEMNEDGKAGDIFCRKVKP